MEDNDRSLIKIIGSVLVILAAGGWTFYKSNNLRLGAVANNGTSEEFARPRTEDMQSMQSTAFAYAGISKEQGAKLEELREKAMQMREDNQTSGPERFRAMRDQMDGILSENQGQKLREYMREQMGQQRTQRETKTRAALGKADYERYQEKRRERMGGRGGPGGGRGPGGGGGQRPGGERPPGNNAGPRG